RAERRKQQLTEYDSLYYKSVGTGANTCVHFLYKSLHHWLKPSGRLGLVLPRSICDSNEAAAIRKLFSLREGNYVIREIVDLEELDRTIFPGAKIVPIIMIAEKRKP